MQRRVWDPATNAYKTVDIEPTKRLHSLVVEENSHVDRAANGYGFLVVKRIDTMSDAQKNDAPVTDVAAQAASTAVEKAKITLSGAMKDKLQGVLEPAVAKLEELFDMVKSAKVDDEVGETVPEEFAAGMTEVCSALQSATPAAAPEAPAAPPPPAEAAPPGAPAQMAAAPVAAAPAPQHKSAPTAPVAAALAFLESPPVRAVAKTAARGIQATAAGARVHWPLEKQTPLPQSYQVLDAIEPNSVPASTGYGGLYDTTDDDRSVFTTNDLTTEL